MTNKGTIRRSLRINRYDRRMLGHPRSTEVAISAANRTGLRLWALVIIMWCAFFASCAYHGGGETSSAALTEVAETRLQTALQQLLGEGASPAFLETVTTLDAPAQAKLLAFAVARGEVKAVEGLLQAGVPVDVRNETGWTPLMLALFNRHEDLALLLLQRGADPKAEAPDGVSVVSLAEALGSRRILWRLASVGGEGAPGELLAFAARTGDAAAVREALEAGLAVDSPDAQGWTALLHATVAGHHAVMRSLLTAGADPNKAASDGLVPLAAALLARDGEALSILLDAKADPNAKVQGVPLLSLAVTTKHKETVERLLAAGADPKGTDDQGARAAELAQHLGMPDLAKKLGGLPKRPKPTMAEALLVAILADDTNKLQRMLDTGVSANTTLPNGWKPLHVAVAKGRVETIRRLLAAGAQVAATTPEGETALMLAIRTEHDPTLLRLVIRELIDYAWFKEQKAITAVDHQGRTALMHAVLLRKYALFKLFTDTNKFGSVTKVVDKADSQGVRPIVYAVLRGDTDGVKELLRLGAEVVHSHDRLSLHDIARQQRHWAILAMLPSDREFPIRFDHPLTHEDKQAMQRTLKTWGYYGGEVNGNFGAEMRAALKAFLLDHETEVVAIVNDAAQRAANAQAEPMDDGESFKVLTGTFSNTGNSYLYKGHMHAGRRQGYGTLSIAGEDIYRGQWRDGSAVGFGWQHFKRANGNHSQYRGQWGPRNDNCWCGVEAGWGQHVFDDGDFRSFGRWEDGEKVGPYYYYPRKDGKSGEKLSISWREGKEWKHVELR